MRTTGSLSSGAYILGDEDGEGVEEGVHEDGEEEIAVAFVGVAEADREEENRRHRPPGMDGGEGEGSEENGGPGAAEEVAEERLEVASEEQFFEDGGDDGGGEDHEGGEAEIGRLIQDLKQIVLEGMLPMERLPEPHGEQADPGHERHDEDHGGERTGDSLDEGAEAEAEAGEGVFAVEEAAKEEGDEAAEAGDGTEDGLFVLGEIDLAFGGGGGIGEDHVEGGRKEPDGQAGHEDEEDGGGRFIVADAIGGLEGVFAEDAGGEGDGGCGEEADGEVEDHREGELGLGGGEGV